MYINILIIDDEHEKFSQLLSLNSKIIAKIKDLPFEFSFVSEGNPEKARDNLEKYNNYDLIILDLIFNDSSKLERKGFELLTYIKDNHPDIPVLMLSSTEKYKDVVDASYKKVYRPDEFVSKSETINKKSEYGGLVPDYQELFGSIIKLLYKFGKVPVKNGILITHGTDTMSWAFSILRYGLSDLKTNIVLTGSQLPLEGTFSPSDAIGNMLMSVKLLNMLEPPNIIQVFNDGVHIFNKNLNKVKKWSFDAFTGSDFGRIEYDELKVFEDDVFKLTKDNKLEKLYFIRTGGTIDSKKSDVGLVADADFTTNYLEALGNDYFDEFKPVIKINPKDSSLFNPIDWVNMLKKIEEEDLAKSDNQFDWNILPINPSPFLKSDYYINLARLVIDKYSGAIILGYGAGNLNIFGSTKEQISIDTNEKFRNEFGSDEYSKQYEYSFIPFFEMIEEYNKKNPNDYKFIIMSSQVPLDVYDIEYQAGTIPLYYGAIPSGDLSYPEAQTKLAYILGHKDLLLEKVNEEQIKLILERRNIKEFQYEQLVKSCFLSGILFRKKSNIMKFLNISSKECSCNLYIHKNNVFVKDNFKTALDKIVNLINK